jgi:NitT/TauT family transport system substrate-binding protein
MLLITACGSSGGGGTTSGGLISINASYVGDFESSFGLGVGIEKGFFKAAGIDLHPQQFSNGPTGIAALQSGNLDFAFTGPGPVKLAMKGNAMIAGMSALTITDYLLGRANIAKISDLKGKTVLYSAGTVSELILVLALLTANMKETDVKLVNISDFSALASAFIAGQGDAVSVSTPFSNTVEEKAPSTKVLLSDGDLYPQYALPDCWMTTKEMLKNHPDTVARFMWAILKTNEYVINNIQDSLKIVGVFTKQPVSVMATQAPPDGMKMIPNNELTAKYKDGTIAGWYKAIGGVYVQGGILPAVPPEDTYLDFGPVITATSKLSQATYS